MDLKETDKPVGLSVAYVFGYGSLVDPDDHMVGIQARGAQQPDPIYGFLGGFQRAWNVAFHNDASERDHKHYVEPASGSRISGAIAMLGISPSIGALCNGAAIPVDERLLKMIEQREGKLYTRSVDIRNQFSTPLPLPLYTYLPVDAGYRVYEKALQSGNIWVPDSYLALVLSAFERVAPNGRADFERTTPPPACPVLKMKLWRMAGEAGI